MLNIFGSFTVYFIYITVNFILYFIRIYYINKKVFFATCNFVIKQEKYSPIIMSTTSIKLIKIFI